MVGFPFLHFFLKNVMIIFQYLSKPTVSITVTILCWWLSRLCESEAHCCYFFMFSCSPACSWLKAFLLCFCFIFLPFKFFQVWLPSMDPPSSKLYFRSWQLAEFFFFFAETELSEGTGVWLHGAPLHLGCLYRKIRSRGRVFSLFFFVFFNILR